MLKVKLKFFILFNVTYHICIGIMKQNNAHIMCTTQNVLTLLKSLIKLKVITFREERLVARFDNIWH